MIGTALIVSFLIPMVEEVVQPAGGKQFEDVLRTLMALVILGPLVASMITLIAVGLALNRRVTVWIDPTLHWFRRNNMWPPQPWGRRSPLELQISLSMGLWLLVALIVLVTMGLHPQAGLPFGDGAKLIIMMACLIAGPAMVLWLRERILEAIVASEPMDCWDADRVLHEF